MYLAGIGARFLRSHVGGRRSGKGAAEAEDHVIRDNVVLESGSAPVSNSATHTPRLDLDYDLPVDYPDSLSHPRTSFESNPDPMLEIDSSIFDGGGCGPMSNCKDITAQMADLIGDIQGIQWSALAMTRSSYRKTRMEKYQQYNSQESLASSSSTATSPSSSNRIHDLHQIDHETDAFMIFLRNIRRAAPTILHFQLRHLVSALSHNSVLTMNANRIFRCDTARQTVELVLDLSGAGPLDNVAISTIHSDGNLLFAGGFHGEVVIQNLITGQIMYRQRLTTADNSISNSLSSSAGFLYAANNDNFVQVLDIATLQSLKRYDFDSPINHCSGSIDGNLLCMVGDTTVGYIVDRRTERNVARLVGHHDFSFASSWHPHGYVVATGNQDKTCRVWDLRNTTTSVATLGGRLTAIRSVRFSPDGAFLGVAEAADFLHVYDCGSDFRSSQTIDFFGVSDQIYGAMLQFERRPMGLYHDIII